MNLGITDLHVKDEFLSPMVFSGGMFISEVSYQSKAGDNLHSVDLSFSRGNINSDVQPRDVTEYVGNISYSFIHRIATLNVSGHPLEVSAGAGISSFATNTDFISVDRTCNCSVSDQSWYWSHAANLHLQDDYRFDEGKCISLRLTMPVARFVSRPENGHYFNVKNSLVSDNFLNAAKQGKLEFFWENLVILTEIAYRHPISDAFDLRLTYTFGYFSSGRPAQMGMYMNGLLAGVSWVF